MDIAPLRRGSCGSGKHFKPSTDRSKWLQPVFFIKIGGKNIVKKDLAPRAFDAVRLCVILLFLAILIVGLCVFDDYGLSTDEPVERTTDILNYRTVNRILLHRDVFSDFGPVSSLQDYIDKYYGVAIRLPLVVAEDLYQTITHESMPMHTVWAMRHLHTFLVYYFGLICFYFLLKHLFENRGVALLGLLMLFLFGRFFAQSFYNNKDMLFVSLLMILLCCAERLFATGRKPLWCGLFALSGAMLVTSRVVGALPIVLVLGAMLLEDILQRRQGGQVSQLQKGKGLKKALLPYLIICCAYPVWLLVTPASWSNPIAFSLGYIGKFSNYTQWHGAVAFGGRMVTEATIPRTYFITWIALTVPIVNQALCLLGMGHFVLRGRHAQLSSSGKPILWISLLMLVGTIGYQFLAKPVVYNGWRHAFFLYPLMILFACYALNQIFCWCKLHHKVFLQWAAVCCVAASLAVNLVRIAKNHPHEYAMFNLVGRNDAVGYERDYWRLSTPELAQWLLDHVPDDPVKISYFDEFITARYIIDQRVLQSLSPKDVQRIEFCYTQDADYVIADYSVFPGINEKALVVDGFEEFHAIWVDETKLASVFKRIS